LARRPDGGAAGWLLLVLVVVALGAPGACNQGKAALGCLLLLPGRHWQVK